MASLAIAASPMPRRAWDLLPVELRRMVLERRYANDTHSSSLEQHNKPSTLATVCREWSNFFEEKTFQNLTLHQSDVAEFGKLVQGGRRSFVKWIWLRLELPEYDCECCNKEESAAEVAAHKVIFTNAVCDLFKVLST